MSDYNNVHIGNSLLLVYPIIIEEVAKLMFEYRLLACTCSYVHAQIIIASSRTYAVHG